MMSGEDWAQIIAAVGGSIVLIVGAWNARAVSRRTTSLETAVATNHGKRPGEYLEMVGEMKFDLALMNGKLDRMVEILADHTTQDAENFKVLRHMIAGKVDK